MVRARWTATSGWEAPQIIPHGPLVLKPSASVLHYATSCFEGMKACRAYDGKLRLFRPQHNCARMLASAVRISLPGFEPEQLLQLIRSLCALDGTRWLPRDHAGSSLYIRPTLIGVDKSLGFQAPQEAILFIMISYWPSPKLPTISTLSAGQGMRLLTSETDIVRAWPGGSGSAKVAANYGPTILAQSQAKKGCDQVLWLFGHE
jgi:branched-chain amino acid aminotransferase